MIIIIFTFIVYVFFIYGVIEFSRRVYIDLTRYNKSDNPPTIKVLVDKQEDIEYTIRSLQRSYNRMIIILSEDIEIPKTIDSITKYNDVEFKYLPKEKEAGRS